MPEHAELRNAALRLRRLTRLGDLSLVPELKFQLFDQLGQTLSREGIRGLHGEPAGLLQFRLQSRALKACHIRAPLRPNG
jgi:hypothetical protein